MTRETAVDKNTTSDSRYFQGVNDERAADYRVENRAKMYPRDLDQVPCWCIDTFCVTY